MIWGSTTTLFGYQALRGDQASRLFHLMALLDDSLFTRDWYVQGYDEMNPHRPYFLALGSLVRLVDWFPALLLSYLLFLAVLFCASVITYRALRPSDAYWASWLAALAVIFCQAGDLGVNPIFESQFKPRMMANALAFCAFGLMLRRPLNTRQASLAGLCVVLSMLAHLGVGILVVGLFGLSALWWCLKRDKSGIELPAGLCFLAFNVVALLLRLPYLLGVDDRLASSQAEIELMKEHYILGHAGHFYPPAWPPELWCGAAALLLLALHRLPQLPGPALYRLRTAGIVLGAVLLIGLVNSSAMWIYKLVLIQPFRLVTVGRSVLAVLVAVNLTRIWLSEEPMARERSLILLCSLTDNRVLVAACLFEVLVVCHKSLFGLGPPESGRGLTAFSSRAPGTPQKNRRAHNHSPPVNGYPTSTPKNFRDKPLARYRQRVLVLQPPIILAFSLWLAPKTAILIVACLLIALALRFHTLAGKSYIPLALLSAAVPIAVLVLQTLQPRSAWAEKSATRWQFLGIPSLGLERVAQWARLETEKESLFLTPPGIPGFRVWSQRAIVLDLTTPPLSAPEIREFQNKISQLSERLSGTQVKNSAEVHGLYLSAGAEDFVALGILFEADYIVTIGPRQHESLEPVFRDGEFHVYRLIRDSAVFERPVEKGPR